MEEELKIRFLSKTIEDLLKGRTNPIPTIICEMDRPHIIELVRKFCLFSEKMIPFTFKHFQPIVKEGLEINKNEVDYGELYILVIQN